MFVLFGPLWHLCSVKGYSNIYCLYHIDWSRPAKKVYNNEFANDLSALTLPNVAE